MASYPANEAQRLDPLRQAQTFGTPPKEVFNEEALDDITRLAAHLCGVPFAAICLVDAGRQRFKSTVGLDIREAARSAAFCAQTLLQTGVFVVPDTAEDPRFAAHPLVTNGPYIRFYAGAPLITPEGLAAGALCVYDRVPRQLTKEQSAALQMLARQAAGHIALARRIARQEQLTAEVQAAQEVLQQKEQFLREAQSVAKIGSWEYNVSANRVAWSTEMFRLLGFDPALGEPDHETLIMHYHPDDIALHDAMLLQALDDGQPYEYDFRIFPSEGLMRWGHVVGRTARDEAGCVVRLFGTLMDITKRKQVEEENARLAAIIENSGDAVLGITLDGTLVSWNPSAERLYGYKESEIIGQHVSVLMPAEPRGFFSGVIQALRRGEQRKNLEVRSRRSDSTWIETVQTFSPIRNPIGDMVGIAAIGHDVTEQRRAEEAVRRSEARLAEAQRVAHIGSWEMDAKTKEIVFSEEMYALFEMESKDGVPPHADLLARYHSSDVEAHTALVSRSLAECRPFVTDMRIVRKNGEIRWVHIIGKPISDEQGHLLRMFGTMMDITERVLVEERFRVLFEHSPEAHLLLGSDRIVDCNQAAIQMFGFASKDDLTGAYVVDLSPRFQPDGELSSEKGHMIHEAIAETGAQDFEWLHQRQDGEQFPAKVIATPVTLNGEPALLSVIHDLTEQKRAAQRIHDYAVILEFQKQELEQANRELCDLATKDGLTGLKNHRAFQERLLGECETALRHEMPLSLLLLDVDHFKQFNDTFGHPAGDAVLKQVARRLERTTRDCDFAARYGGEEFVVVLPQTDQAGALRAAERCRAAIESADWTLRPVTVSVGIATFSPACASSDALIAAADRALYAAKSNGRNQALHSGAFCAV